ncbi:MAG: single-stranded DNA-binding protein [Candidatus Daviesbacteria bacterium]|nr:MAG: single-stranded DNA-binding protein [Candidatus Daviesbacteria bacterium]
MASRSWNRVELIGNLTRDPELRYTPNGAAVATFGIATNRSYLVDGERKEEVDFHRLVAWNKLAELCNQLLKKGNRVFVSGRLQNRSWEGADGVAKNITEIVVEDMIVLSPKTEGMVVAAEPVEDISPAEEVSAPAPAATAASQEEAAAEEKEPVKAPPSKKAEPVPPKEDVSDKDLDDLPF